MAKKIAVVLSGCGFKDGAEITESISTLIALSEEGVEYEVFAPDMNVPVVNHITGDEMGERNVLIESSRISRGEITNISKLNPDDFDGIAFPGGFGAALHLCDFANKGAGSSIHADLEKSVRCFHEQSKPIAAFCIAPALIACILGGEGVAVTIGNDAATAGEIEKTGAQHVECTVDDYVTDRENKVITSPAYMYEAKPHEVYKGIRAAIREFVEMA